jgi:multimeric flavodoxin WrbA
MRIAAVFGSPRKGANTDTMAEAFLREAERTGAEVRRFHLRDLKYQGCVACMWCKTTGDHCVLKDGLTAALDAVQWADTVLIATPVYFLDTPSQMKAFIDRWFSFFKPDYFKRTDAVRLAAEKTMVFVVCQGADETLFGDFLQRYEMIFRVFGFKPMHVVRGCKMGPGPDTAAGRQDLLDMACATAKKVMAGEPSTAAIPAYSHPIRREATGTTE